MFSAHDKFFVLGSNIPYSQQMKMGQMQQSSSQQQDQLQQQQQQLQQVSLFSCTR